MPVFEKWTVSISLSNHMPLENRKRKKVFPFWERFNQCLSKYIPAAKGKVSKNKNSEDFLLNTKQVFSTWNLENFSGEYGR